MRHKLEDRLCRVLVTAVTGLALCVAAAASAEAVPPDAPSAGAFVTDGPVHAITHGGDRTYVGGEFTRVGKRTGSGVVLAPDGASRPFPEVAGGDVRAAIADGSGGWFIGGTFTAVGGQPRGHLAHVRSDGTVDPGFAPAVTDLFGNPGRASVDALALALDPVTGGSGSTLYVGGEFSMVLGDVQRHENIAALNATNGQPIPTFAPVTRCSAPDCSPAVRALAVGAVDVLVEGTPRPQPVLFLGGGFTQVGPPTDPLPVDGVAAVWGEGALGASGSPNGGRLLMATPPGSSTPAPWKPELTSVLNGATTYALEVNAQTSAEATSSLTLYVGGWRIPPAPPQGPFAAAFPFKIDKATRVVNGAPQFVNWRPAPAGCADCAVRDLLLDESTGSVYFGGDFTSVGAPAPEPGSLARIPAVEASDADPSSAPSPGPPHSIGAGIDGGVQAIAQPRGGGTLVVGGRFGSRLLAIDSPSGSPVGGWTPPSPDGSVLAVATDGSSLYAGGDFRALRSHSREGLAAFDESGALLDWAPAVARDGHPAPRVHALAASSDAVYVGGQFGSVSGAGGTASTGNLAAIDRAGGVQDLPGVAADARSADVLALARLGSRLYVGGVFDEIGGQRRANLAAIDLGTRAVAPDWKADVTGTTPSTRAIQASCDTVYVGGFFTAIGGQGRDYLAAVDPASGSPSAWSPQPAGEVLALARSGATLYVGGRFTEIGAASGRRPRQRVAAVSTATGEATGFDPGLRQGGVVRALAATDDAVYVGGFFTIPIGDTSDPDVTDLMAADPATGALSPWRPAVDAGVRALSARGDVLHAGGDFSSAGAAAQRGMARYAGGAGSSAETPGCPSQAPSGAGSPTTAEPVAPTTVPTGRRLPPVRLTSLRVRPTPVRFGRGKVTVRFSLSRNARVRLRFDRWRATSCRRAPARPRRRTCRRYVRFAQIVVRGKRGVNTLALVRQRVAGRRLTPGRYRLQAATLPRGPGASRLVTASFTVRRVRVGTR